MMSQSKKVAKKHKPLPSRVDFESWKQNVARFLALKSPAGEALLVWLQKKKNYALHIGDIEGAEMDSLLESAYSLTRPQLATQAEKNRHDFAARRMKDLVPALDESIRVLKSTGSQLVPKDGAPALSLSALLHHLEQAVLETKSLLLFLDRQYMREADTLNHCIMFLTELNNYKVPEADALALGRALMKAHGFSDDDLEDFSKRSVETGKVRKRRSDFVNNWYTTMQSYLDMHQKHGKQRPTDLTQYKPKQK